jgi:hypothetical protein
MSIQLPEYVEYGPRLTFPPPFAARGGSFLGLVLEGDPQKLVSLCDRVLNKPAQNRCSYATLGPYLIMLVGSWELSSTSPGPGELGTVPETTLALWLPVWAIDADAPGGRLCLFAPYVFVDNPMSLLIGREDFGYAKAVAKFVAESGIVPPAGTLKMEAFGDDRGRVGRADWHESIKLEPSGPTPPQANWQPAEAVAAELMDSLVQPHIDSGAVVAWVLEILNNRTREVFLKQFRDAAQAGRACCRQVVEAPIEIPQAHARPLPQPWTVTFTPSRIYPFDEDLGVGNPTPQGVFQLQAEAAFELECEMVLWPGLIIAE